MRAFPNAKVILTVRNNPEVWHKSVEESIYHGSKISQQVGFINSKFEHSFYGGAVGCSTQLISTIRV